MLSQLRNVLLIALAMPLVAGAAPAADKVNEKATIGYVQLEDDPRYEEETIEAQYQAQPWGRPYAGAEVAISESEFLGMAVGVKFELIRASVEELTALVETVRKMKDAGINFILVDARAEVVAELAKRTQDMGVLLFNITALDNSLRREQCQTHLLHTAPSRAMLQDAMAQFLVSAKWRDVLVLLGPTEEDAAMFESFEAAAETYGLNIVETRDFVLGTNPRQRSQNNVALLTSGVDYDAVYVADAHGEFARSVPYQVQEPRPVVGGAGLVADWWHWAWGRHGAPQLNARFFEHAGRRMTGYDWAAWMAVKAIVEAVVRTKSAEFATVGNYLVGDEIILDGFKGYRLQFRPWNHQLRQPIFLTTYNWVVERAPLEGFLHQVTELDTLGVDRSEAVCKFEN